MKSRKKILSRLAAAVVVCLIAGGLLLCFPQQFFHASVSARNLTLYSDQPLAAAAGERVLALAEAKLAASPLYSAQQKHLIFICNARWRQMIFFNYVYGVGGVNYYPLTTNVFLRDALPAENCLIGPSGKRVPEDRPLDYFIAHEIAHTLTGQAIGGVAFHRLPQWVREGYADYLGKGAAFNYDEAKRAFLADAPEMDWAKSGLYRRYHLLVAYLLERQHWSVQRLLTEPIAQTAVEDAIHAEKP